MESVALLSSDLPHILLARIAPPQGQDTTQANAKRHPCSNEKVDHHHGSLIYRAFRYLLSEQVSSARDRSVSLRVTYASLLYPHRLMSPEHLDSFLARSCHAQRKTF